MKKTFFIFCLSLLHAMAFSQEKELWYRQPAVKWTDALPLGNGRIGAMVFGGIAQDRIQFNEETLWTGEPRNYNHHGAWRYLDSIRQLLFKGKQKEAEALAEKEFMGAKSNEGKKGEWLDKMVHAKENQKYLQEKFDDTRWKQVQVPSYEGWESVGLEGLDGSVWFRTYFDLPVEWVGKDLILDLNRIRDHDVTYVNGELAGAQDNTEPRKYRIYGNMLHAGRNSIAIQVLNYFDKGGIAGYKDTTRHIGIYPISNESAKISLDGQWKYFIQDDSPPAVGTYQAAYQPFGDLILDFEHKANDYADISYKRSLDISTAIATTKYNRQGVNFTREYFISAPNQVMAIQLNADKPGKINFRAHLSSPHKNFTVTATGNNLLTLKVQVKNGVLIGESQLRVLISNGTISVVNNEVIVQNSDRAILLLTAATNYKNYDDVSGDPHAICNDAMALTKSVSFKQLREDHIKEYQKYYNTFSIDLSNRKSLGKISPFGWQSLLPTDERLAKFATDHDPAFVALYLQYGRYLLISSSRPGTRPPNLQGIWNDLLTPPWGSKYTTNINAEMNYWPAELLNLSPMHEPLFKMIGELAGKGKETAKEHYNAPGWVLHHNTDLWRGTAPINAANHGIWVTGGAWLCQHLWERYLFTLDKKFLRERAYPAMKQAALFFKSFLIKDPVTGWLISTPSNSPEQGGLVAGPTMDHQIIRTLFENVINASQALNVDIPLRKELQEMVKKIAPNQIGKYGQLQEWTQDKDDTTNKHRHISHLWGMYPGSEINWDDTPELMKAARQSLLYRGDAATGWSLGWKINCWARFKDGEHAFKMIQMLLSPVKGGAGSYTNLFDAHPPFQIDGNFGGAAGIGEMFIQSHTQFIDILPALPEEIVNGSIKGICARGGFVFDMEWLEGKLTKLVVTSKAGMPLSIRYNGKTFFSPATKRNEELYFDGELKELE